MSLYLLRVDNNPHAFRTVLFDIKVNYSFLTVRHELRGILFFVSSRTGTDNRIATNGAILSQNRGNLFSRKTAINIAPSREKCYLLPETMEPRGPTMELPLTSKRKKGKKLTGRVKRIVNKIFFSVCLNCFIKDLN